MNRTPEVRSGDFSKTLNRAKNATEQENVIEIDSRNARMSKYNLFEHKPVQETEINKNSERIPNDYIENFDSVIQSKEIHLKIEFNTHRYFMKEPRSSEYMF